MSTQSRPGFRVVLRRCLGTRRPLARHRMLNMCALAAVVALYAYNASALDVSCPLDIGNVIIRGNVHIAARCTLTGTEVRGDVTLFAGGSLTARDVRIKGNLNGNRADFVDMEGSRVDGTLRLEELVGDVSTIERTDIHGDLLLSSNRSHLNVINNEIEGDLQATDNTGGLLIAGNSIDHDLECAGNTPIPLGLGNRVDGDRIGQCKNLQAEAPPSPPPLPTATPLPPAAPPPTSTPVPESTPAPSGSAPSPTTLEPEEVDGGAGAIGWPVVLLLPLLGWRVARRKNPGTAANVEGA